MADLVSFTDMILVPFYLFVIFGVAVRIKSRNIQNFPEYEYFLRGLYFKVFGVSMFMFVYLFYYQGGDTINYFLGSRAISELIIKDFSVGIEILLNPLNDISGWKKFIAYGISPPPYYMWKDPSTFFVSILTAPLSLLGFRSFLVSSLLTTCLSYVGIWKLYRLFNIIYPGNSRAFAYLILFLPSLIFWGGGIMKDSFVLGATCWITYNFYQIFIARKKIFMNITFFIINLLIIINIKAYIIISLFPGMALWLNSAYLKAIRNPLIKFLVFPIIILGISGIGFMSFSSMSSMMGAYGDVDTAIEKAQVIQEDLLRTDQYGKNNYDLGTLDGSLIGLIRVAPTAILTAIFRPLPWEIGSPTMILSALENITLIVFTLYILLRCSPFTVFKIIFKDPFLVYCFIFSITFAFGVGIAGTNFGALVRYKIPLIPFFFSMIYMVYKRSKIKNS
jgi:hypothetical protein